MELLECNKDVGIILAEAGASGFDERDVGDGSSGHPHRGIVAPDLVAVAHVHDVEARALDAVARRRGHPRRVLLIRPKSQVRAAQEVEEH